MSSRPVRRPVTVADGKLTVDAIGGTNTKINFLEIVPADVTAPGIPENVDGDGRRRFGRPLLGRGQRH